MAGTSFFEVVTRKDHGDWPHDRPSLNSPRHDGVDRCRRPSRKSTVGLYYIRHAQWRHWRYVLLSIWPGPNYKNILWLKNILGLWFIARLRAHVERKLSNYRYNNVYDLFYDYVSYWDCFCTYCTKKYRCLLHFSIIVSQSALSGTTALEAPKQVQKYKTKIKAARPRPRPIGLRPVLSQTAVIDPKTVNYIHQLAMECASQRIHIRYPMIERPRPMKKCVNGWADIWMTSIVIVKHIH